MSNPVAFVTGASRGIGRNTCLELARHGYDIVAAARTSSGDEANPAPGSVEETASLVREYGRDALPIKLDMGEFDQIRNAVTLAHDRFGHIDLLMNNAVHEDTGRTATLYSKFAEVEWESLENHLRVVVFGTLLLTRLVTPGMVERRHGIVINITQNMQSANRSPRVPWSDVAPLTEWLQNPDHPLAGEGMVGSAVPITRGVTDRLAPALMREFAPYGVSILTLDPTLTLSNAGMHKSEAQNLGFVAEWAHSVLVPARAVAYVATCHNPMIFNGKFVVAEDLVRSFGLMSEAEIQPPLDDGPPPVESLPRLGVVAPHADDVHAS